MWFRYQESSWFQLKIRVGIPVITSKLESCFIFRFSNNKWTRRLSLLAVIFWYAEVGCLPVLFPDLKKWVLKYFFTLHSSVGLSMFTFVCSFITFKQSTKLNGDLWSFLDRGIFCRTSFNLQMFILFRTHLFKNSKFSVASKNAQIWWNLRWCF